MLECLVREICHHVDSLAGIMTDRDLNRSHAVE
jgi:hypothetical protein